MLSQTRFVQGKGYYVEFCQMVRSGKRDNQSSSTNYLFSIEIPSSIQIPFLKENLRGNNWSLVLQVPIEMVENRKAVD